MSKIGILGDLHFGCGINLGKTDPITQINSRLLDYEATFNRVIDYCIEQGIKLVVQTGDIFEHRNVSSIQHKIFAGCVKRALDKGLLFVFLIGNHDQQRDISTNTIDMYKTLQIDGVSIFEDFGVYNYEGVSIFLMPYRDRKSFGVNSNQEALNIIQEKLDNLGFQETENKIVVGHYMFLNTTEYSGSENFSMTEIFLDTEIFKDCKATICGHIHKGAELQSSPKIFYSGSMERNNYGEKGYDKGVVVIDTDDYSKSKFVKMNVRDLYEIKLDYSEKNIPKGESGEQLYKDIDEFCSKYNVKDSIIKLSAKIDESDLYIVNQNAIKAYLYDKGVNFCSSISISSFLRISKKTEIIDISDSKKVLSTYVDSLEEDDNIKKDMIEYANIIINDIDGESNDSTKIKTK